ncbi:MAG: cell division protein FtsQ/DivIB [Prochlorococcus sp.]
MKSSASNRQPSQGPGIERRRKLRRQRRRERLIYLWRMLIFTSIALGLGWLLLSQGWSLSKAEQIHVQGSDNIQVNTLITAGELRFPQPLLGFNPKALEQTLLRKLPIKSVVVHRRLLPPGIDVDLQERIPIAYALRRRAHGQEQGMVDIDGQWIPVDVAKKGERPPTKLTVDGWTASQRQSISRVLEQRDQLGSPLERIIVAPDGELSLRTKTLGLIQLGANSALLDEQLDAVAQLSQTLPPTFRQKPGTTIDMSDPSKPELQIPQPVKEDK